jgi:uncharacterized protein YyaL (SSP411 family)
MTAAPAVPHDLAEKALTVALAVAERSEREGWRGIDPYDGLSGTRVPGFLRRSKRGRQLVIQSAKRSPVDVRTLLGVRPARFAKALAVFVAAYARLAEVTGDERHTQTALDLAEQLVSVRSETAHGWGWGYEFDVQTRWAFYPAGTTNVIVTVFAGHALADLGERAGSRAHIEAAERAASHVAGDLLAEGDTPFFRYVGDSPRLVHNANMIGVGLVSRVAALAGRDDLGEAAARCAPTTVDAILPDGTWPYGEGPGLGWADGFHTAYVLDGLAWYLDSAGDESAGVALQTGMDAYLAGFFDEDGLPRYTRESAYPIDVHSGATAVDVLSRRSSGNEALTAAASRTLGYMLEHMYDGHGGFYFQEGRALTNRTVYVRWGQAHMLKALASYLEAVGGGAT